MPKINKGVTIVVTLLVIGLLTAFLAPIAISEISDDETATYNQTVGETVTLQPGLNSTLDAVNASADATYTVNASGNTATTTINENQNGTVTVDGIDVTINVDDTGSNNATATYEYPTTYGWGDGATALWTIIPVMIVLAIFLFVTFVALREV